MYSRVVIVECNGDFDILLTMIPRINSVRRNAGSSPSFSYSGTVQSDGRALAYFRQIKDRLT